MTDGLIEATLKRDRRIVIAATIVLVALSWMYVLLGSGTGMSPIAMTATTFPPFVGRSIGMFAHETWSMTYWLIMLFMWWIMMIAMMTPSAAPMVLLHAAVARRSSVGAGGRSPVMTTVAFVAGYLSIWFLFSVLATGFEWSLECLALVSPMFMWSESARLTGVILILAGAYQLTPFKSACLEGCRSPIDFLSRHWSTGVGGTFRMGLWHGAYCVGCCWALMLLLFAGGVMNLIWIAGLSIIVIIEKSAPFGRGFGWAIGGVLLMAGIVLVAWPEWSLQI
ncbi:MAG TPA: DUF2182 domain-containing protein [Alphaproteobacteria bacterium]|nr:DUF2182 domain-containing protein [Alphaproteobacteria bacterium]